MTSHKRQDHTPTSMLIFSSRFGPHRLLAGLECKVPGGSAGDLDISALQGKDPFAVR